MALAPKMFQKLSKLPVSVSNLSSFGEQFVTGQRVDPSGLLLREHYRMTWLVTQNALLEFASWELLLS